MLGDWEDEAQTSVVQLGQDIIGSGRFWKAMDVPHHFGVSIADHSLRCARYALAISRWLEEHGVSLSEEDAVRASLLHDMGMTEDEVFESPSRVKAYTHPREGARIATEEYGANDAIVDAIRRHMWPIGHVFPRHLVGWVVVAADKCSSIAETHEYVSTMAKTLRRRTDG